MLIRMLQFMHATVDKVEIVRLVVARFDKAICVEKVSSTTKGLFAILVDLGALGMQ
jgi:hypothetical protein